MVEGVNHIVGAKFLAVVEGNIIPEVKLQRDRVHPLVGGCEQRLILKGLGVAEQERVPAHIRHDHDFTSVVVIRQGDIEIPVRSPSKCVIALACKCKVSDAD